MDYHVWNKGDHHQLSEHFSTAEFECHCGRQDCRTQRISLDLVTGLEHVRAELGYPITVVRGYSCEAHQDELRAQGYPAAKDSQHPKGNAADLSTPDLAKLHALCDQVFAGLGYGPGRLHADVRPTKARWTYA